MTELASRLIFDILPYGDDPHTVRSFLQEADDPNVVVRDWTVLHRAARFGRHIAVKILLADSRVDPNILRPTAGENALAIAMEVGHQRVIRLLLDHPTTDVNWQRSDCGSTLLHIGVITNQKSTMKELLSSEDMDPNIRNNHGFTPFMQATFLRFSGMVRLLAKDPRTNPNVRRVDPNRPSVVGPTVLHIAVLRESVDALRYFLKRMDLDPNMRINTADLEEQYFPNQSPVEGATPLLLACLQPPTTATNTIIELLANDPRVDVNARISTDCTAVHILSDKGNAKGLRSVLGRPDVNPNILNHLHRTPLINAVRSDADRCVLTLAHDLRTELDARDGTRGRLSHLFKDNTAMGIAKRHGKTSLAQILRTAFEERQQCACLNPALVDPAIAAFFSKHALPANVIRGILGGKVHARCLDDLRSIPKERVLQSVECVTLAEEASLEKALEALHNPPELTPWSDSDSDNDDNDTNANTSNGKPSSNNGGGGRDGEGHPIGGGGSAQPVSAGSGGGGSAGEHPGDAEAGGGAALAAVDESSSRTVDTALRGVLADEGVIGLLPVLVQPGVDIFTVEDFVAWPSSNWIAAGVPQENIPAFRRAVEAAKESLAQKASSTSALPSSLQEWLEEHGLDEDLWATVLVKELGVRQKSQLVHVAEADVRDVSAPPVQRSAFLAALHEAKNPLPPPPAPLPVQSPTASQIPSWTPTSAGTPTSVATPQAAYPSPYAATGTAMTSPNHITVNVTSDSGRYRHHDEQPHNCVGLLHAWLSRLYEDHRELAIAIMICLILIVVAGVAFGILDSRQII